MGALTAGQAQALVVNVDGQDWDVTTFTGSYNANSSKFATAANGGVMPWWGDRSLAQSFLFAVRGLLGYPNGANSFSPDFAFRKNPGCLGPGCGPVVGIQPAMGALSFTTNVSGGMWSDAILLTTPVTWAQANLYTSPAPAVPSPLHALGAAAAFSFSRKLRKRIKASSSTFSFTYSP
jgi:hypothetical protein